MKVKTIVTRRGGAKVVAEKVGVSQVTVYGWMRTDRLPGYAADVLGVKPRGKFMYDGRINHPSSGKPKVAKVSWWQRFISWVRG